MKAITVAVSVFIIAVLLPSSFAIVPVGVRKFQWSSIDYSWKSDAERREALEKGYYVPESILPTGLARWEDKLFITVPRWKKGVPSSLNYINASGPENQKLNPYPSWTDGYVPDDAKDIPSNKTVVSAFKCAVDKCDRLWVVDNGVVDMARQPVVITKTADTVRQMVDSAILAFDLKNGQLLTRYVIPNNMLRETSVLSSIEVECTCENTFVYITDMGANALLVYDLKNNESWRVEHKYFKYDPLAAMYNVGGIRFFWGDGISSTALGPNITGHPDIYFHPTSGTVLYKISTQVLRSKATEGEIQKAVQIVGNKGPNSQATALTFDQKNQVLFYTLINQNGVGCWHVCNTFEEQNTPVVLQDNDDLEFVNDVKVDADGNIWVLSDRQSRFLYDKMNFKEINFRIIKVPIKSIIANTTCDVCDECKSKMNRYTMHVGEKSFGLPKQTEIRNIGSTISEPVPKRSIWSKIFKRNRNIE